MYFIECGHRPVTSTVACHYDLYSVFLIEYMHAGYHCFTMHDIHVLNLTWNYYFVLAGNFQYT